MYRLERPRLLLCLVTLGATWLGWRIGEGSGADRMTRGCAVGSVRGATFGTVTWLRGVRLPFPRVDHGRTEVPPCGVYTRDRGVGSVVDGRPVDGSVVVGVERIRVGVRGVQVEGGVEPAQGEVLTVGLGVGNVRVRVDGVRTKLEPVGGITVVPVGVRYGRT